MEVEREDGSEDETIDSNPDKKQEERLRAYSSQISYEDTAPFTATKEEDDLEPFQPTFYFSQLQLSSQLVERINFIIQKNPYTTKRSVDDYSGVYMQIFTAKLTSLERQTRERLIDPSAQVFSQDTYLDMERLQKESDHLVCKYSEDIIDKYFNDTKSFAENNPHKLVLVIADEAHCAITNQTASGNPAANDTVVNSWDDKEHSNVIVIQVCYKFLLILQVNVLCC